MTATDTLDLVAIRRAISDPGAVLPRDLGDGFQPAESVSNWSARAVLAVLAPKVEEMQAEIERLRQKDRDALAWEARLAGHAWALNGNTHALAEQNEQMRGELAAQAVAEWNETHPVGTPVTYWPGVREGNGKASRTRTPAQVLNGHTAVVWVDGYSSCIALTHVEPGKVWDDSVAPGGWVCAWPHPDTASGICGYPVESEPCTRDHVATIKFDKES